MLPNTTIRLTFAHVHQGCQKFQRCPCTEKLNMGKTKVGLLEFCCAIKLQMLKKKINKNSKQNIRVQKVEASGQRNTFKHSVSASKYSFSNLNQAQFQVQVIILEMPESEWEGERQK